MRVTRKGRRSVHLLGVSTTERRQSEQLGWAARASSFDNRDTWSLNAPRFHYLLLEFGDSGHEI